MHYFTVTIDVEPDCTPNWVYSNPLTFDGVAAGIRGRLQPLFNRFDVCPTYLINNVVLEDPRSVETFRNLDGRFELGTHLHGEFIEPGKQFQDYAGKRGTANQCALPPAVELEKMRNLTRLFERSFDRKPTSFRAGRFSAGPNTIRCLQELGYKVDTSVTPHVNWQDETREFPVDYNRAPEQPYLVGPGSLLSEDRAGTILEVPVSIEDRWILWRHKPIWLRPVYSTYRQIMTLVARYLQRYGDRETVVLNMMFHNVEVLPLKSPYTRTEEDCRDYLAFLERFFVFCRANDIQSIHLSGLHELFTRQAAAVGKA